MDLNIAIILSVAFAALSVVVGISVNRYRKTITEMMGMMIGMTMGMMTRTARGHTGRALTVDRYEVACFVLVEIAALVRVFGGMLIPGAYLVSVVASGILWSAAFALYAVRYWPVLSRERIDGKHG